MKRYIVTLGLSKLSIPSLVDYIRAVITAMTGNPDLPSAPINLDDVTTDVNALDAAWLVSQGPNSGSDDTATVVTLSFGMVTQMNYLASYVQYAANEDHENGKAIIFSANMSIKAFPINTGRTFEVQNTSIGGQVLLRTRSERRVSYEWQYTTDPAGGGWTSVPSTSVANTMISGLTPGLDYFFRARANKGTTPGPWQGPVNMIIT